MLTWRRAREIPPIEKTNLLQSVRGAFSLGMKGSRGADT